MKSYDLEKHKKYKTLYKPNEVYWGMGIENEIYLEMDNGVYVTPTVFMNNHKRERYSVDYNQNYKKDVIKPYLNMMIKNNDLIKIPLLMNAHSFTNTDVNNEPRKKYTKLNEPNPKFKGTTLIEDILMETLQDTYEKEWLFDGDTIEFTTIEFYNTTMNKVINELNEEKVRFIKDIQEYQRKKKLFLDYGTIRYMNDNYPFAMYLTNYNNIAMFNNGTFHYNITLPTKLNEKIEIDNPKQFKETHKKAIRMIQWFEPLMISIYNTPDPFSEAVQFSKCSQRCAISRYIGIGTYDTDIMLEGKQLTTKLEPYKPYFWYKRYHKNSNYTMLDEIGYDINYHKHYNHGIEIRFLDYISDQKMLKESREMIIHLMDYVLDINEIDNPIINPVWNDIMIHVMENGKDYIMSREEKLQYELIFKCKLKKNKINDVYYEIYYKLIRKYNDIIPIKKKNANVKIYKKIPIGAYSKLTIEESIIDDSYLQLIMNNF
jgi:hypothetical protein